MIMLRLDMVPMRGKSEPSRDVVGYLPGLSKNYFKMPPTPTPNDNNIINNGGGISIGLAMEYSILTSTV